MKSFDITQIGNRATDVSELGKQLLESLGDELYKLKTKQRLLYHTLKQVEPIRQQLEYTSESIEKGCQQALNFLGFTNEYFVQKQLDSKKKSGNKIKINYGSEFMESVLELTQIPGQIYDDLKQKVFDDLLFISNIIIKYESHNFIKKYLSKDNKPVNHEERTILDFYRRCIKERATILHYYLYDVKKRALGKSRYQIISMGFFDHIFDRPYYLSQNYSYQFFDYEKIDIVGHRLKDFTYKKSISLEPLYHHNKRQFYQTLFEKKSSQEHFDEIFFNLNQLPISNDRTEIFKELKSLFDKQHWIGFYSLALTQIEGIFAEMNYIVNSNTIRANTLPKKVNSIRSFHEYSRHHFDYFEYYIPNLRNKFSHIGYDEGFELKSYDLLTDLTYLFVVFNELDDPFIKINKIHKIRRNTDFIQMENYIQYFQLLKQLKHNQKEQIKKELTDFESKFLTKECYLETICFEAFWDIENQLNVVQNTLKETLQRFNISIPFSNPNTAKRKVTKLNDDKKRIIWDELWYNNNIFERLEIKDLFLKYYGKYLPSIDHETKNMLEEIISKQGSRIHLYLYIFNHIKRKNTGSDRP